MTSDLASRIQSRLDALGKSASSASVEAGLGRTAVRDILNGKSANARLDTLQKLTVPLQCSLNYLTGLIDNPGRSEASEPDYLFRDEQWKRAVGRLEAGVFRENHEIQAPSSEEFLTYKDRRYPTWGVNPYIMGDASMSGQNILPGDIISAAETPDDTEIPLTNGMLVVVEHHPQSLNASELSARKVVIEGGALSFVTAPSSSEPAVLTVAPDHLDIGVSSFSQNRYYAGDSVVAVQGVVVRITRKI